MNKALLLLAFLTCVLAIIYVITRSDDSSNPNVAHRSMTTPPFKEHYMYKDGNAVLANTHSDHLNLSEAGYTHSNR